MSNTKIVVFQMKEIVYTILFLILGILFVVIFLFMFRSNEKKDEKDTALYHPGVYSSECKIGNTVMNVSVAVDENHINAVSLENLNESITTMYPLVESAVHDIESSLKEGIALNDIPLSDENRYTKVLLLEAVEASLHKASAAP